MICDDERRTDTEIGDYIVTLFKKTGIIRFSENKLYLMSKPVLDIGLQNWLKIKNRFTSVINYKVIFLKNYSLYARLVHDRIVNYYINQVKNTNPLHFTLDFLMNDIINLQTSSLPKSNFTCKYEDFDYNVCFLIDAEIRHNAAIAIYIEVCSYFVNSV